MFTKENAIKLGAAVVGLYAGYSMLTAIGSLAITGAGLVLSAAVALAAYTAFNHVSDLIKSANTKKTSDFAHDYYTFAQIDAAVLYQNGEKLVNETAPVVDKIPSLIFAATEQGATWFSQIKSKYWG
jgi:hypothetical protein